MPLTPAQEATRDLCESEADLVYIMVRPCLGGKKRKKKEEEYIHRALTKAKITVNVQLADY